MTRNAAPDSAPGSVLVVRLGAMGDVIHTLSAVTALRCALPEAKIGWIIEERWAELLCARSAPRLGPRDSSRPLVDVVHVVNTKSWRKSLLSRSTQREIKAALQQVQREEYECAVDFQGAIKSAVVARCAGAKVIFGLQHPRERPAKMFYQRTVPNSGAHVIEQYHSLAEALARRALPQVSPELPRDEEAESKIAARVRDFGPRIVLINPGAGWAAKEWPAERYGEVVAALAKYGFAPVINFGPGEEELASAIRAASHGAAIPIECSISELIALTRRARLFIGGDTGPLHLAAALRIPVVAIFGPTDPARNGPYGTKSIVIRNPASRTSLSHTSRPDPGLMQITSDEVIAAARRLVEETDA